MSQIDEVVVGWFISERSSSEPIALAFRHAVLPRQDGIMGLPESIYVDNGKDFRSHYLEGQSRRLARVVRGELAQRVVKDEQVPIFTSQAAREAWQGEHWQGQGDDGHEHW